MLNSWDCYPTWRLSTAKLRRRRKSMISAMNWTCWYIHEKAAAQKNTNRDEMTKTSAELPTLLRSKWRRQARLYRDLVSVQICCRVHISAHQRELRAFYILANQAMEFLWQEVLGRLRFLSTPGTQGSQCNGHIVGDVTLPADICRILSVGPKLAVPPRESRLQQLSFVRQVSRHSSATVSQGVDVLDRCKNSESGLPVRRVASFLHDQSLRVLPADEECGVTVLPSEIFKSKSREAISSVFNARSKVSLSKVKPRAMKLLDRLNFSEFVKAIDKSKNNFLTVFFHAETHKVDVPLRTIVSKPGTWQHSVALFLQCHLKVLPLDDPFIVSNFNQVLEFFNTNNDKRCQAFWSDIKNLLFFTP